jgi:hypothetical protein
MARWLREEQEKESGGDDEELGGVQVVKEEEVETQTHIDSSDSSNSRDTWTPVHVEPTYGPCNRCYPRNLKLHSSNGSNSSSHVTPPPTPPEERDKFECLYLLVDTAISRMERERGKPWK